jgi:hypothetical protein
LTSSWQCALSLGAEGRTRTADTRIFSPVLYQLSYLGTLRVSFTFASLGLAQASLDVHRAAAGGTADGPGEAWWRG